MSNKLPMQALTRSTRRFHRRT